MMWKNPDFTGFLEEQKGDLNKISILMWQKMLNLYTN